MIPQNICCKKSFWINRNGSKHAFRLIDFPEFAIDHGSQWECQFFISEIITMVGQKIFTLNFYFYAFFHKQLNVFGQAFSYLNWRIVSSLKSLRRLLLNYKVAKKIWRAIMFICEWQKDFLSKFEYSRSYHDTFVYKFRFIRQTKLVCVYCINEGVGI